MRTILVGSAGAARAAVAEALAARGHDVALRRSAPARSGAPADLVMALGAAGAAEALARVRHAWPSAAVLALVPHAEGLAGVDRALAAGADDALLLGPDGAPDAAALAVRLAVAERRVRGGAAAWAPDERAGFVAALLEHASTLVVVLDAEGRIVRFNPACERATGYAAAEVVGTPPWERLVVPEEADALRRLLARLGPRERTQEVELHWRARTGERLAVAWSHTALVDDEGRLEGVVAVGLDLTQGRRMEAALRDSERMARAVLDTTVDGIITIDVGGVVESFNAAAERIFGYAAREVVGRNVSVLMPEPYHSEHDGYIEAYHRTGRRRIIGIGREVVGRRKDGAVFPLDLAVSEVHLDGRTIYTGVVRDISERRRLEQEVLAVTDQERRRIGQDLHDGLGQMLTGIGLIGQHLARALAQRGAPEADEVQRITDLVREADRSARDLARGLVPVELEANGLEAALVRFAAATDRVAGVSCTLRVEGAPALSDAAAALHLYRIAQEAVANALRHGHAAHLTIRLAAHDGRLVLRVEDDGVGLPDELGADRGMGLHLMGYRARLAGGTLSVERRPEGGTSVTCTVPLDLDVVGEAAPHPPVPLATAPPAPRAPDSPP